MAVITSWFEPSARLGAGLAEPLCQEPFGAEAWLLDLKGKQMSPMVR